MTFIATHALAFVIVCAFACGTGAAVSLWALTLWLDGKESAGKIAICEAALTVAMAFFVRYFAQLLCG